MGSYNRFFDPFNRFQPITGAHNASKCYHHHALANSLRAAYISQYSPTVSRQVPVDRAGVAYPKQPSTLPMLATIRGTLKAVQARRLDYARLDEPSVSLVYDNESIQRASDSSLPSSDAVSVSLTLDLAESDDIRSP
jgi:hypothetical protein